ncbi:Polar-differentiation response regulator DivK [Aquisphaera giovannonii]|uniref:Polar-differentiation response regulator DivK n=1 Tax=Aquisphaera giovannonii TaxID=406548 RepID=A0A5B9VWW0_9BACT|nr:response regulator [Aquisphaera giovannonii]QEH32813.1 Polar-differentiation response regulator DivK [Aquisphaera giovannonii]
MASPPSRSPDAPARNSRVLIVDDNKDLALSLARLLSILGYEVRTEFDGARGIEAAREFQPRAILLDIGLPRIDGYQVARTLRDEGLNMLIIAISGYGQEEDRRRSQQAGMDHHVTKPVDVKTIASLIGDPA